MSFHSPITRTANDNENRHSASVARDTSTSSGHFLRFFKTKNGFTLVELVVILIIVGILSSIAARRFFDRKSFDMEEYANQTQAMLRYGQKLAIAQNRPVWVRLNGVSMALCYDAGCSSAANYVVPPAGTNSGNALTLAACGGSTTWFCEANPNGITYTALNAVAVSYLSVGPANATFFFNALGKPFNTGDTPPTSNFNQLLTITLSGGGGLPAIFYVERETGYVHR